MEVGWPSVASIFVSTHHPLIRFQGGKREVNDVVRDLRSISHTNKAVVAQYIGIDSLRLAYPIRSFYREKDVT